MEGESNKEEDDDYFNDEEMKKIDEKIKTQ